MADDEETATPRYIASNVSPSLATEPNEVVCKFWGDICVNPAIWSLTDIQIQVKTIC